MTKTNKTLLCVLLALVMTFALALTALTVADTQTAKAEGTFEKVTSIADGDSVIIVCESKKTELTGVTSKNIGSYATYSSEPAGTYVLQVIENDDGTVSFKDADNKYLALTANSNSLYLKDSIDTNSKWSVTFSSSGNAEIKIKVSNTERALQYNAGSGQERFCCYKSGQTAVQIYKQAAACDHSADKLTHTAEKAATCTEAGNVEYYTCTCGKSFADAAATTELTETAIPALGHTFDWTLDADTTMKTGVCSVCGYEDIESSAIANIYVNGVKLSGADRQAIISIGNQAELTAQLGQAGNPIYPGQTYDLTITGVDGTLNYIVSSLDGDNLVVDGSALMATIAVPAELMDEFRITVMVDCAHAGKIKHDRVEATCLADGAEEYWECPACGVLSSTEDMSSVISAPIAIAKLAHAYGADHVCTNGCGKTEDENLVLKIFDSKIAKDNYYNNKEEVTLTGTIKTIGSNFYLIVGGLDEAKYKIQIFTPSVATGKTAPADGDRAIVKGKIINHNGIIEFERPTWEQVTVVASKFEVSQSIAAGDGSKEVTDEISGAKTIYVKNGSQIVVTYAITANDGINTFIATLKYNKALFSIVSVTITDGFGAGTAVKSGNVGVTDYKVYIEGDGEGYTANYKGEFVTVVYQFNGDATATIDASEFGLMDVTCYTNHASGFVNADTTIGTSAETFDFIKQASITVEKTSFVYNGKAITAIGKGEHDQIKVTADGEGAISYKWYTDGTYATEVGEGYEVKNAGKYYLKLIVATTAAFEGSELKVEITITPFDLKNADSEIVITANDKQVTGSALTWTVAELTINGGNLATARGYDSDENIFTATIAEHSLTNVGETQNVAVTLALNANYTYGGESSIAATVTLKVVAYANAWTTEPQNITKDFDNNKLAFAYAAEHGTPVYYLGGEVKTAEELANAIVNAGTYEVKIVVEVVGYSNLEKTITITINKLKIDASSMEFDYSEDGKIKWSNPTKAIGSTGAIDLPTVVKFTYTLVDGKTENYGEDAVLEYLAQAEGAYTLNVIPGDAVNYEGTSTTTKTVYTITFAEGTHDGDNVIEGVAAYATVYRFDGQNAPAAPAAPVLAGYRFDGWTNSDMFGVAVTASVTLTAQWVKTYVIAWNNDNGSALESKTVDAGTQIAYSFETAPTSVLGTDDYYTYTFAGWKDGEEVRELGYTFTVNGDITVTATYTSTLAYVDVTYNLTYGNNTTATDTIAKVAIDTAVSAIEGLPELKAYTWFKNDGWKCGENAFIAATANLANEKVITISATYAFAIGLGDVDGSGTVDPSDIVLYRKHIVGGYDITPVTDAWTTATAADFDESKVYFLAQVANVDEDGSDTNDVRDVSTIRMALVGAYGYTIKNGAVIKGSDATAQSAKVQYKQVLAPMGLFGKKFAL